LTVVVVVVVVVVAAATTTAVGSSSGGGGVGDSGGSVVVVVFVVVVVVVTVLSLSRWLKYEERVEIGERWSKPHVSTTSLRGLLMFRDALIDKQCSVGLSQPQPTGQYQVAGNNTNNN